MPQKVWTVGEEVLAADFQTYVQNQTVPAFPNAATRDSQWTAPPVGALCVLTDSGTLWRFSAAGWVRTSPVLLGLVDRVAPQSALSNTAAAITGLTLTETAPTGHWMEVGAHVQYVGTAGFSTDSQIVTELRRDGVTITRHQTMYRGGASVAVRDTHYPKRLLSSDGAAHTYTVWVQTVGSGFVISTEVDPDYPAQLWVHDLGRQTA